MNRLAIARCLYWLGICCAGISTTWRLWDLTGQAWWLVGAGLTGVLVGILCAPVAGQLADRPNRRRTMMISLCLAAVLEIGLAFTHQPLLLMLVAQLVGISLSPFGPAFMASFLSSDFPGGQAHALGRLTSFEAAGMVGGTLLAGVTQLIGKSGPFLFAAAMLLLCAAVIASSQRQQPTITPVTERKPRNVWAGLQILRQQRVLRLALGAAAFMAISRQLAIVAEAPLIGSLGGGGSALAIVSAAWSIGMLAGGPLAGRTVKKGREIRSLIGARFAASLGMASLALSYLIWQPALAYLLCGIAWAWVPVASNMLVSEYCDDETRGRLLATQGAFVQASQAAGMLMSGLAIAGFGIKGAFLAAGLFGLASLLPLARAAKLQSKEITA